jgi:hypothetical protein
MGLNSIENPNEPASRRGAAASAELLPPPLLSKRSTVIHVIATHGDRKGLHRRSYAVAGGQNRVESDGCTTDKQIHRTYPIAYGQQDQVACAGFVPESALSMAEDPRDAEDRI